jgi:hypothetical protein
VPAFPLPIHAGPASPATPGPGVGTAIRKRTELVSSLSPPLHAAFWRRRSEPVKVLRVRSAAWQRLRRPVTEPSPPLPCRKKHEAGALNEKNWFEVLLLLDANRPYGAAAGAHPCHTSASTAQRTPPGVAQPAVKLHRNGKMRRRRSVAIRPTRDAWRSATTQLIIKFAVDYLIEQVPAGKSETSTANLAAMARSHNYLSPLRGKSHPLRGSPDMARGGN